MKQYFKYGIVALRVGLGLLFIYAGIQKFVPKERPKKETSKEVVSDVSPEKEMIKGLIGGMKKTPYFWPMVGVAELLAGVLLLSQVLALLGAVILVPLTLNIFLFHIFLTPQDYGENIMTGLYLFANLLLIAYHYPSLKKTFLTLKVY